MTDFFQKTKISEKLEKLCHVDPYRRHLMGNNASLPVLRRTTNNNMKTNGNYIGISAINGGVSLGMIALIAIFSPDHMTSAPWIVGALSLMGFGLGYLSSKPQAG